MKHVELRQTLAQQTIKDGRANAREIWGTEDSSDLGTKYLERKDFEKHRAAAGAIPMRAEAKDAEIHNVEGRASNSSNDARLMKSG